MYGSHSIQGSAGNTKKEGQTKVASTPTTQHTNHQNQITYETGILKQRSTDCGCAKDTQAKDKIKATKENNFPYWKIITKSNKVERNLEIQYQDSQETNAPKGKGKALQENGHR